MSKERVPCPVCGAYNREFCEFEDARVLWESYFCATCGYYLDCSETTFSEGILLRSRHRLTRQVEQAIVLFKNWRRAMKYRLVI